MYLTRMELDITQRKTLLALSMPNLFHGAVESAFQDRREERPEGFRPLWRIDRLSGKYYLMIVSREKPDLTEAARQFSYPGEGWITKEYDGLLKRAENGSVWRFKLCANPTYSVPMGKDARGRVCAHSTTADQRKWLIKQSVKHGFAVGENGFDVTESRWYHFNKGKGKNQVSLLKVTYEGILRVTDEDAFRKLLTEGVGREKAYGAGLMTIVRTDKYPEG